MLADASVSCKGAFATTTDNWLSGYSWLACSGKMAGSTCSGIPTAPFATLGDTVATLMGPITSSETLDGSTTYLLSSQVFVQSPATLTIMPGATIYAMPTSSGVSAPALVVEKGASINAAGTAASPITMTTVLAESALSSSAQAQTDTASSSGTITLGERGKWGGLILLGNAPTSAATPKEIEGISGQTYGGTNPSDGSGTLQYVRVWHGGAVVGADNEINGITFGGVGSGTVVEYCEVAYNADDGFEYVCGDRSCIGERVGPPTAL